MRALLATALIFGGASLAHAQVTLPDGPGKSQVAMQCVTCHAIDVTVSKRGTVEEWRAIVKTMVERGAAITDADTTIIAAYLGQHFGPGAPVATQASALPDLPGRDVLTKKCMQCHAMSMWTALRQDRRAWESTVFRMVGRGALWTEDEIRTMADYLARVRGPQ